MRTGGASKGDLIGGNWHIVLKGPGGDNHWMNMRTNYDLTMASATVDVSDINPHFQFEIVEATID